MDHEWLAEIPFYLAWRAFGSRGIFLVTLIAIEAILLGILGLAYLESGSIKAAFIVGFAAMFLASVSFGPRTLLFGWIFLVLELGLLAGFRRGRDFLWALPFVFLLWINAHGSWIIGMVVLAVVALSGCVQGQVGFDRGDSLDPAAGAQTGLGLAAVDPGALRESLWMAAGALSLRPGLPSEIEYRQRG